MSRFNNTWFLFRNTAFPLKYCVLIGQRPSVFCCDWRFSITPIGVREGLLGRAVDSRSVTKNLDTHPLPPLGPIFFDYRPHSKASKGYVFHRRASLNLFIGEGGSVTSNASWDRSHGRGWAGSRWEVTWSLGRGEKEEVGGKAGGTHPTGMHTCFMLFLANFGQIIGWWLSSLRVGAPSQKP